MCLLIAKPAGVALPENIGEICEEASFINDDGFGFATPSTLEKQLKITPKSFSDMLTAKIKPEEAAIIHFRYSTSGTKDDGNCHPFIISDGTKFAHNGNISYRYQPRAGMSDTAVLASTITSMEALYAECQKLSGHSNKFAMIPPGRNEVVIVGETYGSWGKDGLWYSNDYWRVGNRKVSMYPTALTNYAKGSTTTESEYLDIRSRIQPLINKYGYSKVQNVVDSLLRNLFTESDYYD